MKKLLGLLLSFATLASSAGCVPVVVGGAVAGGVAYYNRHAIDKLYTDTGISNHAIAEINKDPNLHGNTHIVVATKYRTLLLAGQVPFPSQRIAAERAVSHVPGIRRLYNEIEIAGPSTNLTRASDSWITSKVKTQLMTVKPSPARHIKVVTENGAVYLLGNVSHAQANAAVYIARGVPGVQKVVKLFRYEGD